MIKNKIIYSIDIEDIQTVANDLIDRDLTKDEIKKVESKVGDYIGWYDAIEYAINSELGLDKSEESD